MHPQPEREVFGKSVSLYIFSTRTMAGGRLSIKQRQFIVESMIKTSSNVKTRRMFFLKFNFRVSDKAVRELHSKWKKDGTARDMHAARSGRPVTARTSANVP